MPKRYGTTIPGMKHVDCLHVSDGLLVSPSLPTVLAHSPLAVCVLSRFGKFVRVYFDKEYFINGASITNYLLEKSRCVFQSSGERNYHIFYQLLAGAPPDMKERFKLKRPEDYNYVNRSGCISIAGVDDVVSVH